MDIKTARELTEKNCVNSLVVYQNWDKKSAWISVVFDDVKLEYACITTAKGKNKIYKSFAALFNDLQYIGCDNVTIYWENEPLA